MDAKPVALLGISAFYHDSAACVVVDGEIIAAAQEERFSRRKHDPRFPINAVRFCLDYAGLKLSDLHAVSFYDKPLLKFERLLETYYGYAPKGISSFLTAMPVWMKEKLFLKKLIKDSFREGGIPVPKDTLMLFPEHHLSHAASTYYPSPFDEAAILTIDGVGEWATASIGVGEGEKIRILREMRFPHSLGLLYSAFTYYLGFRVNSGEYKLMGLAPYGDPSSLEVASYVQKIQAEMIHLYEDGSLWLNPAYFSFPTGLRMVPDSPWESLFGIPRRMPETEFEQRHCNLALAIQQVTEEAVLRMARTAKQLTGKSNICLAGGVALNCVANGRLQNEGIFERVFITPPSGDAGGALGAAFAGYHLHAQKPRTPLAGRQDRLHGAYLGPAFSDLDVEQVCRTYRAPAQRMANHQELATTVAALLAKGLVVGWCQGRMEFGPRALGARSILGDPRNPEMQLKLNLKIKYRESFRPFAPAVLAEKAHEYFQLPDISPYMLIVQPVADALRKTVPEDYHSLGIREKLYHERSTLPSITHIDFSARIQTVHTETNPRFHELLTAFDELTGCAVLVNTSFNVRGEPIVSTPEDAYRCFMRTEMDVLVLGDFVFFKEEQPPWQETDNWKNDYVLD